MSHFIEIDSKKLDLAKLLLSEIPNGINKAMANAINRTTTGVRQMMVKAICERYYIKQPEVRKAIAITKAVATDRDGQSGKITARGTGLPLIKFNVDPKKALSKRIVGKKVKAGVLTTGLKPLPNAFVKQFKNGGVGVLMRKGSERYPIKQLYALSVPQMMDQALITTDDVQVYAQDRLDREFDGQVDRLLRGINV